MLVTYFTLRNGMTESPRSDRVKELQNQDFEFRVSYDVRCASSTDLQVGGAPAMVRLITFDFRGKFSPSSVMRRPANKLPQVRNTYLPPHQLNTIRTSSFSTSTTTSTSYRTLGTTSCTLSQTSRSAAFLC